MVEHLPWALQNIFNGGLSYVLAQESVIPSCVKLTKTLLECSLLREDLMRPEDESWLGSIKSLLSFIHTIINAVPSQGGKPEEEEDEILGNFSGSVNRDLVLHHLPMDSLLEFCITAELVEINSLAIQVIGTFYSSRDN